METGIKETLENICAIGLYEDGLEDKLSEYYNDPVNGPEMVIYKEFSGQQIRFELYLSIDYGQDRQIKLCGYDLLLPCQHPPIAHQVNNGLDSQELEERMKAVDWSKHPGNFFEHKGNQEWEQMDEIMKDLDKFMGIDEDRFSDRFWKMVDITAALMSKYLTGTPLATALMMNLPYFRGTFYDMYPFPPDMQASVGGNNVNNLVKLKKLSEKAMESYSFANQLRKATKDQIPIENQQYLQR